MSSTTQIDLVQNFLNALDQDRRECFLTYVDKTYSVYEIWLYAGVLGYDGGFSALEKWILTKYPKLNSRELMLGEIVKLEGGGPILEATMVCVGITSLETTI